MVTRSLTNLSLCTGIAGLEIGLKAVIPIRTICYVENEVSVAAILAKRMEKQSFLDEAPIWSDLRTFDADPWRGRVDIVSGGFPCQPFSVAGHRLQENDPRNLWPDTARLIRRIGSPIVFLENVPGIIEYYFDTIRPELRAMGYEVTEGLFSASETGAPHLRQRIFILAHANSSRSREDWKPSELWTNSTRQPSSNHGTSRPGEDDEISAERQYRFESGFPLFPPGPSERKEWDALVKRYPDIDPTVCTEGHLLTEMSSTESELCRASNGTPNRMDSRIRLRAIGNAVVPAVAANAFRILSKTLSSK